MRLLLTQVKLITNLSQGDTSPDNECDRLILNVSNYTFLLTSSENAGKFVPEFRGLLKG